MIYYDTSYLVRLYLREFGWEEVRKFAAFNEVVCSMLGRTETLAAFHQKFREGGMDQRELRILIETFESDCQAGAFQWLPVTESITDRVSNMYAFLPNTVYLRASDAVHLASAAENGFEEIYSNDKHLLTAAPHFKLKAVVLF